jgi:hypothetical protein
MTVNSGCAFAIAVLTFVAMVSLHGCACDPHLCKRPASAHHVIAACTQLLTCAAAGNRAAHVQACQAACAPCLRSPAAIAMA